MTNANVLRYCRVNETTNILDIIWCKIIAGLDMLLGTDCHLKDTLQGRMIAKLATGKNRLNKATHSVI